VGKPEAPRKGVVETVSDLVTPRAFYMEAKVDFANIWMDWSEKQRLDAIKSLIWTAPDNHDMCAKVEKMVTSNKFKETLD
jgi:hypothetical protein